MATAQIHNISLAAESSIGQHEIGLVFKFLAKRKPWEKVPYVKEVQRDVLRRTCPPSLLTVSLEVVKNPAEQFEDHSASMCSPPPPNVLLLPRTVSFLSLTCLSLCSAC